MNPATFFCASPYPIEPLKCVIMFEYFVDKTQLNLDDCYVAETGRVTSTDELFDELSKQAALPSYFGRNWNALEECLRDLSWIPYRWLMIIHEDVPNIPADDLRLYIDVLSYCQQAWRPDEEHGLRVAFPFDARHRIEALLHSE